VSRRKIKYSGGRHAIQYGLRRIEYDLTYGDRQDLAISVHPNLRVSVKAPIGKAPAEVKKRVLRRARWIVQQLVDFERFQPLPTERQYVSGETHLYLGRQYRLRVIEGHEDEVKLVGGYIEVRTGQKASRERVRRMVIGWFTQHAKVALERRLDQCVLTANRANLPRPPIRYRPMKRRWGSCTKNNRITLNLELAKAPVHCIDYVIMHELCHLRYKNHSRGFWRLLSRLMPDWEKRKMRLEHVVV